MSTKIVGFLEKNGNVLNSKKNKIFVFLIEFWFSI